MAHCAVKRGFFTLRPCGNSASQQCMQCQRWVCEEHSVKANVASKKSPPEAPVVCLECHAKSQEWHEDRWGTLTELTLFNLRHDYYTRHIYDPIYWATPDAYYDDYDFRGFDDVAQDSLDGDIDSAGLMDS